MTKASLRSTLTDNQKDADHWVKTGQVAQIVPAGQRAKDAGLILGRSISVSPQIKIIVNVLQTAQNLAIYGNAKL